MALDDINDNKKIKSKSSILRKYKQFKDGEKDLKKSAGDTFEQKKSDITTQLSEAKRQKGTAVSSNISSHPSFQHSCR